MLKVFINNNSLEFISDIDSVDTEGKFQVASCRSKKGVLELIQFLESKEAESEEKYYLHAPDMQKLKKIFLSLYKKVDAAGGIVRNKNREILMIFRNGCWDLPKGKLKKNEDFGKAALREAEEECGLQGIVLGKNLQPTFHTYIHNRNRVLKTNHWFEMFYDGNEKPIPQLEEDITDAVWLSEEEVKLKLKNSFASIRDLLLNYLK